MREESVEPIPLPLQERFPGEAAWAEATPSGAPDYASAPQSLPFDVWLNQPDAGVRWADRDIWGSLIQPVTVPLGLVSGWMTDLAASWTDPTCVPRVYGVYEYVHWWTRGMCLPPLVTTSPDGTPLPDAGVLGLPDTVVLFGNERRGAMDHPGGRFELGVNLDCAGWTAVELDYLVLGETDFWFGVTAPDDASILARPYFNTFTGSNDAELVGYPGVLDGSIQVEGDSQFQGGGVSLRRNLIEPLLANDLRRRLDFVVGWRFLELDETLSIREDLVSTQTGGTIPPGTEIFVYDWFRTENEFHGGDVGFEWDWGRGRLGATAIARIALGSVRRRASIVGVTAVTEPGSSALYSPGGLLALPSNMGNHEDSTFTAVPEFGGNVYFLLRPGVRVNFGYTLIFFPDVWRPGDAIDLYVDPRQLPPPTITGATSPSFGPRSDSFWAQGLNLGFEVRY
jgi:hypothetical protein